MAETTQGTPDPTTLYRRLCALMEATGAIDKTGTNQSQHYGFIESAVVLATIRPLLVKLGIAFIPEVISHSIRQPEGARQAIATVTMRFHLINADDPADRIEASWVGEGADMGDKAINKAITAGTKYFLLKLLMLSDKEDVDPDAESAEPPARQQPRTPQAPTPIRTQAAPIASSLRVAAPAVPATPAPTSEQMYDYCRKVATRIREEFGEVIDVPDGMDMDVLAELKTHLNKTFNKLNAMQRQATAAGK